MNTGLGHRLIHDLLDLGNNGKVLIFQLVDKTCLICLVTLRQIIFLCKKDLFFLIYFFPIRNNNNKYLEGKTRMTTFISSKAV